jgi:hypothetical protein
MSITFSRRQVGDADRVGGIELMIPWPSSLGPEPGEDYVRLDHEREANATEKTAAEALVKPACEASGLVPVHVRVTRLRRPGDLHAGGEARVHLAVTIIGRRWVHARGARRGRIAFAKE